MPLTTTTKATLLGSVALMAVACGTPRMDALPVPTSPPVESTATAPTEPLALPEPTGTAAIGVRDVESDIPSATVQIWYPAAPGTGSGPPKYLSSAWATELGVGPDFLVEVELLASVDAAPMPTDAPRPGVVLMPGLGAPIALSTTLAQDLVSNGYVVLTIDPALGSDDPDQPPAQAAQPGDRIEQLRAGLDFLAGPDVAALSGPVDPTRIAAGGHSLAGAIAVQASLTDPRIAAVFDLDGWLHGPALDTPVGVPALFVEASGFDQPTTDVIGRSTHAVTVRLARATHFDVTDAPCLAPALGSLASELGLGTIGCSGPISTNALVERFLTSVLMDGNPILDAQRLADGLEGIQ